MLSDIKLSDESAALLSKICQTQTAWRQLDSKATTPLLDHELIRYCSHRQGWTATGKGQAVNRMQGAGA